ncbi:hypothetical protein [Candidatus Endomicrobiellum devescovinae]|uniref:hypothetical protein n=1 Tax=Candidatus Endomicrobiellum devescovinae TaxID=3242322 RepID=UPI0028388E13|nr:hypothetical protein [Endomicrobium sp.]
MTRMRKKIMCLALSLAFGVMSSQAQAIGNSTQILAERDSTILKFRDLGGFGWRSQPRSIVFHPYYVKNSEDFNIYISYVKSLLLSNQRWTPYAILGTIEHTKKIIEEKIRWRRIYLARCGKLQLLPTGNIHAEGRKF